MPKQVEEDLTSQDLINTLFDVINHVNSGTIEMHKADRVINASKQIINMAKVNIEFNVHCLRIKGFKDQATMPMKLGRGHLERHVPAVSKPRRVA